MSRDLAGEQMPPGDGPASRRGAAMMALTASHFFVGGLVLFVALQILLFISPSTQEYDGAMTLIAWSIVGVMIAVLGFIACAVLVASGATAYALATPDGSYASLWLLCAAWVVFTVSVAHFVWPARWRRSERHSAGESHTLE